MPRDRNVGTYKLPSGQPFTGPVPKGAEVVERQPPPDLSAEGRARVLGETITRVYEAITAGDHDESDRLLRRAVHVGVSPTDLILAFASGGRDQGVQPAKGVEPVVAEVARVDLPADPAEVVDGEGDGPAEVGDEPSDSSVTHGETKATSARKRSGKASG